jgi:hypothetical protein
VEDTARKRLPHVEAWSSTSTVTLRFVGGDEKGKSRIRDSKVLSRVPRETAAPATFSAPLKIFQGTHRFRDLHMAFKLPCVYDYIT